MVNVQADNLTFYKKVRIRRDYMKVSYLAGVILLFLTAGKLAAQKTWMVDTVHIVDGAVPPYDEVQPGDTIYFQAGVRNHLLIRNFTGTPAKPVIMMNKGGVVDINTGEYYGISIRNCRYFRFSGQGDKHNFYGIKVSRVAAGACIGIGSMSSDFEIDHISVENSPIGGIYAKTDPDCSFLDTRDNFTQHNTIIHDNYIANVGNEALYIGSTQYFGHNENCNGRDTVLLPSLLDGVRIYNNIIKYPGWDGIQVSSASNDCRVFNNVIIGDSQNPFGGQMAGIMLGGGSKCDCYNNYIGQGNGDGIENHGLGGNRIFNNIIVDAGQSYLPLDKSQMKYGIFVTDISVMQDSAFQILFNDIINPKSDGIRFQSIKSRNSLIASNLIINPGNYDYYENLHTAFHGTDSYIMVPNSASSLIIKNNFLTRNITDARISSNDYSILPGSPLINAAFSKNMGINFDYNNVPRPIGVASDIGALEFDPGQVGIYTENDNKMKPVLYPNPVRSLFTIKYFNKSSSVTVVELYDLRGNKIFQKREEYSSGDEQQIQIDAGKLPSGIYFYCVNAGGEITYGKFIKVK